MKMDEMDEKSVILCMCENIHCERTPVSFGPGVFLYLRRDAVCRNQRTPW